MWLLYHHVKFIFSFVLFSQVLRLICLQCIVNSGFKPKVLEQYKREIIHTYGFEHFLTLENLEKAGLLHVQQGRSTYATIRKTMQLTVDDVSEHDPTDMSYVHSGWVVFKIQNWSYPTIGNFISNYCEFGKTSKNVWVKIGGKVRTTQVNDTLIELLSLSRYAPLSARLVEFLQSPGWRAITGVLQLLPGPTLTETQQLPSALRQRSMYALS